MSTLDETQKTVPQPDEESMLPWEPTELPPEEVSRFRKYGMYAVAGIVAIGVTAAALVGRGRGEGTEAAHTEGPAPIETTIADIPDTTVEAPSTTAAPTPVSRPAETGQTAPERETGHELTSADWEQEIKSSVLIADEQGTILCNGAKTEYGIVAARHCAKDNMSEESFAQLASHDQQESVKEITGMVDRPLYVLDMKTHQRLAKLDRMSATTGDVEVLMASVTESTPEYDAIHGRSLSNGRPEVGDKTAANAAAYEGGHQAKRFEGTYLGTIEITDDTGHSYSLDITGYADADIAQYMGRGFSGHLVTTAGGKTLGPELYANIEITDPAQQSHPDSPDWDTTKDPAVLEEMKAVMEAQGLNTQGFRSFTESVHVADGTYDALRAAIS